MASAAERKRAGREGARRREAVDVLKVADNVITYAIGQLGNGISRNQARQVGQEAAEELSVLAGELRRLTRLSPLERRVLAVHLHALGMPATEVARRLGVTDRSARSYIKGLRSDGQPWA